MSTLNENENGYQIAHPQRGVEFLAFDREHPEIWNAILTLCFAAINRGRTRFGMQAVVEVVRWERNINYDDREFKVKNEYVAYYARKFMLINPQYGPNPDNGTAGLFSTKHLTDGTEMRYNMDRREFFFVTRLPEYEQEV